MKPVSFCVNTEQRSILKIDNPENKNTMSTTNIMQDNESVKLLHTAAFNGETESCTLLLEFGADVNAKDSLGYTPLHKAAWNGHADTCKLLLKHGAEVNTKTTGLVKNGTPLHWAAAGGYTETCKMLLDHGADVNAMDEYAETPLHWATLYGHVETRDLLRDYGAVGNY